jgi:hypothetical protein
VAVKHDVFRRFAIAVLVVAFASAGSIEADEKPSPVTAEQVKNADTCLPSLADPPDDMVPFRDGKYASESIPFAEMRAMAFGEADSQQIGVVEIVWNTGGSGNWEVVELFREANGKAVNAGVYSPAGDLPDGGTMVGRIDIREGKILLYGEDPVHGRKIPQPLVVTPEKFERCRLG